MGNNEKERYPPLPRWSHTKSYVENKIETVRRSTTPSEGLFNCGVRQGFSLSRSLFNLYIDDVIHN